MKNTNLNSIVGVLLITAFIALIFASFFVAERNKKRFTAVCEKNNGNVVWDGRQLQCIGGAQKKGN